MGRIRHTAVSFGLLSSGYWLRASAFSSEGVIARVELDEMSWREMTDVLEVLVDQWRPGVELLNGGTQPSLFD